MTALDAIRKKLGTAEPWVESRGTYWLNPGTATVRAVAWAMNSAGARFITITAYELPGDAGFRLEYHWDLEGRLLGVPFEIAGKTTESIVDLIEAADWIEREVHEGFAIDFTGRLYEPLMLREGDKPGVNLRVAPPPNEPASGVPGQKEVAK
ncbi:MAG: NADH-quinone oxidoreductase subunit C [Terracidiphilus sp.]